MAAKRKASQPKALPPSQRLMLARAARRLERYFRDVAVHFEGPDVDPPGESKAQKTIEATLRIFTGRAMAGLLRMLALDALESLDDAERRSAIRSGWRPYSGKPMPPLSTPGLENALALAVPAAVHDRVSSSNWQAARAALRGKSPLKKFEALAIWLDELGLGGVTGKSLETQRSTYRARVNTKR